MIRRARAGDAAAIVALEALFPSDRMSLRSVRRFLRSPGTGVWVALAGGEICGALVLLTRRRSGIARIYSVVVHPRTRGQGLAQQLIGAAEAQARGRKLRAMSLEIRTDNRAARALYSKLGYAPLKTLPAYYDDGADGLRLLKNF